LLSLNFSSGVRAVEPLDVPLENPKANLVAESRFALELVGGNKYISSLKNTGSGTKPIFKLYLIQLFTYVTYYLLAFGTILKYPFWLEPSDLRRVTDAQSHKKDVEHNIVY
jgi:hypothetical protein